MKTVTAKIDDVRERIKSRRLELNYTQHYLAKNLKMSQHAYSKIETGASPLLIGYLLQIAVILQVDSRTLVD